MHPEAFAPNILFPAQNMPLLKRRPEPPITHSSTTATSASTAPSLNLAPDGSPLTYAKSIRGDNELHWRQAEIEEFDRLFSSKATKPLYPYEEPTHRRKDTSYYNPQMKEREDAESHRTYIVRGTIQNQLSRRDFCKHCCNACRQDFIAICCQR